MPFFFLLLAAGGFLWAMSKGSDSRAQARVMVYDATFPLYNEPGSTITHRRALTPTPGAWSLITTGPYPTQNGHSDFGREQDARASVVDQPVGGATFTLYDPTGKIAKRRSADPGVAPVG